MGRAFTDNEGTVHIEDGGYKATFAREVLRAMPEPKPFHIVTERRQNDDPLEGRGAVVACLVGVILAFAGVFGWAVYFR